MEVWKGVETSQVVKTTVSGASCGYENFEVDEAYLGFAYGSEHQLKTGRCERTNVLSAEGDDVAALGEPYAPVKQVDYVWDSA